MLAGIWIGEQHAVGALVSKPRGSRMLGCNMGDTELRRPRAARQRLAQPQVRPSERPLHDLRD